MSRDYVSQKEVENTIAGLGLDDLEAEDLRNFYRRERRGIKLGLVLKAFYWAAVGLGFLWVAWVLADAALDWLWQGLSNR